ncbi:MAG: single-stranded-DNA-specific exonuclease RecJ [Candidatus Omnitrophota bacterium]|jgi:single-stranded-DNA-specific exonuclease
MYSQKIIRIASQESNLQAQLSRELGISRILAQVLINRGIRSASEAQKFLNVELGQLQDPFLFAQMDQAVGFIKKSIEQKEKILIFSDYDVDGVTALTLLETTLSSMGAETFHYIPNRIKEGYGLNPAILTLVKEKNIKLLITADCGTNSHELIRELRKNGITVIVTDHHEPQEDGVLHAATAMINPKLKDSNYSYRDLAGVGVAYKLCQALTGKFLKDDLDIVALGTVADCVPLTGENRVLVKEGLTSLAQTKRIGLRALMEVSRLRNKKITPEFISFILGPRINAGGRMDTAEISFDLLMSQNGEEAEQLARTIEDCNRQRQKVENNILEEAGSLIDREVNFKDHKIVVLAKEGWHPGVLGIVAAKLVDRFYRPTILISLSERLCRGSGRSIKNFHLFEGIEQCSELLSSFGGHQHAVGMVIERDNIDVFRDRINKVAHEKMIFEDLLPSYEVDMELSLEELTDDLIRELAALEPFGSGNTEPLFYTRGLELKGESRLLGRETLKFWVTDGKNTFPAIGFGKAGMNESLQDADSFDMVYKLRIDTWNGEESLILEIKDMFFR